MITFFLLVWILLKVVDCIRVNASALSSEGCTASTETPAVSSTFYKRDKHHKFSHELWNELYKSKNTGSKVVHIDLEVEEQREEDKQYSRWSDLPDLLLEKIFSYLSVREKYYASLVCKSWYRVYVWSRFVLENNTLTSERFNYYSGLQQPTLHFVQLPVFNILGVISLDLIYKT